MLMVGRKARLLMVGRRNLAAKEPIGRRAAPTPPPTAQETEEPRPGPGYAVERAVWTPCLFSSSMENSCWEPTGCSCSRVPLEQMAPSVSQEEVSLWSQLSLEQLLRRADGEEEEEEEIILGRWLSPLEWNVPYWGKCVGKRGPGSGSRQKGIWSALCLVKAFSWPL